MLQKILLLLIIFLTVSCQKEEKQNPFEIKVNRIGQLTNTIQVRQLDSIYSNDSIVKSETNGGFSATSNQIEIYEKGGAKLLILEPKKEKDSTSTIENIQIIDSRYKTETGLSSNGTFKDIKDHYPISKINNTLSSVVLFVDNLHASITIDKKELSDDLRSNTDAKIEASQIPDSAKIKYFLIHWDDY